MNVIARNEVTKSFDKLRMVSEVEPQSNRSFPQKHVIPAKAGIKLDPRLKISGMTLWDRISGMTLWDRISGMTLWDRISGMTLLRPLAMTVTFGEMKHKQTDRLSKTWSKGLKVDIKT